MSLKSYGISVERLFDGAPIIWPTDNWWESGVTFNAAAIYLERSPANDPIIRGLPGCSDLDLPALREGVVAVHYRARPKTDPGYQWNRSFVGIAVFTPALQLLARSPEPVITPGEHPDDPDYLGVEDPRVTRIGETFYVVYCGAADFPSGSDWKTANCLAVSQDLLHWTKLGAFQGDVNDACNKDGVLFPEPIDGKYFLLHRPMVGNLSDFSIHLAISDTLPGTWHDCGMVLHSRFDPDCLASWVGAGAVPIPLGDRRYLILFHTGNRLLSGEREYDLDAAVFDFDRFTPDDPSAIVVQRIDRFMVPETDMEIRAPFSDSVANVLFTCGAYEFGGYLYILYGGGDSFIMAARIRTQTLLAHLERNGVYTSTVGPV